MVRSFLTNLLLILSSVLSTLIVLELLLALLAPQQLQMATTPGSFFLRYDTNIGWVNKEDSTGEVTAAQGMAPFRVRINAQGFRGQEALIPKPARSRRIVFLGDSNTFGYGIEEGARFTDLLAKRAPAGTEILNFGVFGYGTDQEAIFLERQALRFSPDMVVLVVSAGDLSDVMSSVNAGAAKPFCRIIDGKFTINNIPVPPSTPLMSSRSLSCRSKVFFYRHSHLYRLLQSRVIALNRYMADTVQEMDEQEGFAVMVEVIKGMKRVCREGGAGFKVLLVSHGEWIEGGRRDKSITTGYYTPLKAALQAEGVAVIDTTEAFVSWLGPPLFFPQDAVHLTVAGNKLIADTFGKQLLE